jgi:hypothetical protein
MYTPGYVFDQFGKKWASSATPLTVMDFSRVFVVFQGDIEKQLMEGCATVLDEESPVFAKSSKMK